MRWARASTCSRQSLPKLGSPRCSCRHWNTRALPAGGRQPACEPSCQLLSQHKVAALCQVAQRLCADSELSLRRVHPQKQTSQSSESHRAGDSVCREHLEILLPQQSGALKPLILPCH